MFYVYELFNPFYQLAFELRLVDDGGENVTYHLLQMLLLLKLLAGTTDKGMVKVSFVYKKSL